jgi:hypothetical protein
MTDRQQILLTDRTTSETDWKCGMKRWWYKEEAGTGIVPVAEAPWFEVGRQIHDDFARLRTGVEYNLLVSEILTGLGDTHDQLVLEPAYRRMGWIIAYALYRLDREAEEGEDIAIESEIVLDRDPLWVVCTPDRLYRRYLDNRIIYRELKSCKYANYGWVNYWPRAVQLHVGLAAAREEYDVEIAHGEVMGLVKGEERDGRLMHPYVWSWWHDKEGWVPLGQGAGKRDLTPRPVWEYDGGIVEWVKKLGPDVANAQFPFSAPIFLDDRLLKDYIQARTFREKEVRFFKDRAQVDRELRARHFEPRFSECSPMIGAPCPYLAACHNAEVNRDPLGSGLYTRRTPHHEIEIVGIE